MPASLRLPTNPLLRRRDGRLFLASQALDQLGAGVASVALPWLVLESGGSNTAAGLVFTLTILPYVLFGLPAGVVGDRFPRRRVIWVSHVLQAGVALLIPVWGLHGAPPLAVILLAAFGIGVGRVFADAAAFGAVAALVGREGFTEGQALLSAAWAVGLLSGPGLGGALIHAIGAAETLVVEAAAFGIATLLVLAVRTSFDAASDEPTPRPLQAMREGMAVIFGDPLIRAITWTGLPINIVLGGVGALAVPLLKTEMALTAPEVGWVLAAGGTMGVVAVPVVGAVSRRIGGPRMLVYGLFLEVAATAAFGLAHGLLLVTVTYCALTLVQWSIVSAVIGERQRRAPQRLQARVGISGRMIALASLAAGSALASSLTATMTLRQLYVAMAVAGLAVAAGSAPVVLRAARRPAALLDG